MFSFLQVKMSAFEVLSSRFTSGLWLRRTIVSLGHVTGFPITFLKNLRPALLPPGLGRHFPVHPSEPKHPEASYTATWPVGSRNLDSAPLEPGRLYSLSCFLKFQAAIKWL